MTHRKLCVAAWLMVSLVLVANHAPAQPAAGGLEYRKVFVPEGQIEAATKTAGSLKILERKEFQQYIDAINAVPGDAKSSGAQLVEASFSARLDQADLVGGKANLKIEHPSAGAMLNLEPCSLAIGAARWSKDLPARLGAVAAGKLAVVVEPAPKDAAANSKISDLQIDWTLRGARDATGGLVFDVQLPSCPTTTLTLDLPVALAPSVADAVVTKGELVPDREDRRLWTIEFGGNARGTLSIGPAVAAQKNQPRAIVSQTTLYELSPEALAASFELHLNIEDEPLSQLAIDFQSSLQLTSIRLGETPLAWSPAAMTGEARQRAVIEFAEPLAGHDRVLKISALARVERDKSWTLPTLHASAIAWQDGTMSLVVPPTLELGALTASQARQTKAATAPSGITTYQFQGLASGAHLAVVIRNRRPRLQANEGLTLKWDGPHLTAHLVSDLSASEGNAFECRAMLPSEWTIDSLESVPPGRIENWTLANATDRTSTIEIRLAKALTRDNPVQLNVIAHRRAPLRNERLQPQEYRLLDWQQFHRERRIVAVQTEAQQQLALFGDAALQRLDPRALSAADKKLVDAASSRLLFLDASTSPAFTLALRPETPRFTAETATQFKLGRDWLSESHAISVDPDSSLSRLVVRFSAAMPRPVQWKLEEPSGIVARQLAADEGELWELSFARPLTQPCTIIAERQTALRAGDPPRLAPLVTVNAAESQTSDITIDAREGARPLVEQRGLSPIMWNEAAATRAKFRYQPASDQQLTIASASDSQSLPALFAWNRRVVSRVNGAGEVIATAFYQLQNAGETSAQLQLPDGAVLRQVRVEGTRVAAAAVEEALTIPLPADVQYPTLQVEYSLPQDASALTCEISVPAPRSEFPVLSYEAEQWISPEWDWVASDVDWRTRWLGPLAGSGARAPRSLFSWQSWREQLIGQRLTADEEERAALVQTALQQALGSQRTWGEWCSAYNELAAADARLPVLQIDAVALARIGIYDDTPLDDDATAQKILRTSGVDLVSTDERLILTSWEERRQTKAEATRSQGIYCLVADGAAFDDALSISTWQAQPQPARTAWRVEGRSALIDLESAGWRGRTLDSAAAASRIYRWQGVQALAWGVFLVGVCCGWLLARRTLYAWLLIAIALAALWIPAPWVLLATGALLGTILGGMAGALRVSLRRAPIRRTSDQSQPASTIRLVRQPATIATALIIGWFCWDSLQGQEPREERPKPSRVAEVYFPVDADQKPTNLVYVPTDFYAALVRQARLAKAAPHGWMVYEASYRGDIRSDVAGKLQFSELTASYDLEVFQANTRVSLALARDEVHLLENGVTLEGRPVRIDWLENGEGFTFEVATAGKYRLELSLRPVTRVAADREQATLKLPRVHRSRLALKAPPLAKGVQIAGARGQASPPVDGNWTVDIGPAANLSIYWPIESETKSGKEIEATQLLWWHIRPGAVTLESQWKFKSAGDPLTDIRLVTDPRLKLLPLKADQPVAEQSIRDGEVQAIHFALKQPYEREVTLQASFSLAGAAGVGNLQLPKLEAVVDRTTSRMLGVSVAPELHADAARAEAVTPREFAAGWKSMELPAAAYRLLEGAEPLMLSISPRELQVSARQALTFAADDARMSVELEALVQPSGGMLFQHPLELPAGWELDEVQLFEGNTERAITAAEGLPGSYTLFINSGLQAEHRIVVRASSPFVPRTAWTLPLVRLAYPQVESPTIFLERTSGVRVETIDHNGYEPLPGAAMAPSTPWRRIAVLRPTGDAARQIILKLERAGVKFTAQQLLSVVRQGDAWQAVLDIRGRATGGTLETLRFDLPAELNNLRLNADAKLEATPLPGQPRQHVTASFAQPFAGDFAVRLTAPLAASTLDRLQVPDIRLLDAEALESFVALPSAIDDQQLAWNTRGLQAAAAPAGIGDELPQGMLVFTVPSGRFQATVRRSDKFAGVPQVRLADLTITLANDGCYGVASFDLEPAGLTSTIVQMPEGATLVAALVDGKVGVVRALENGHFELQLHHEQLPQHVEVAFSMPAAKENLAGPTLMNLPVERTHWTVYPATSKWKLQRSDEQIEPDRMASLRLKNASAALEYAGNHSAEGRTDVIRAWLATWRSEAAQLEASIARSIGDDETLTAQRETLAAEAQSLAETWNASDALEGEIPAGRSSLRNIARVLATGGEPITAMVPGASGELAIQPEPRAKTQLVWQILMSTAALVAFAAWLRYRRLVALHDCLARFPHVPLVLLGIAWWLWLSPALVGLAICVVFAAATLRKTGMTRRARASY